MNIIVTDFGCVQVSASTLAAMDAQFPGWREPRVRGRTRAIRHYNARADDGQRLLENAAFAIAALAFYARQDLVEI